MGHASVPAGSRRYLSQTPSVPEADVDLVRLQSVQKKLKSTELRGLDGLGALAKEHAAAISQLLGSGGRTLVPNFKVRVATACSGSAADRVSMAAVKAAVSPVCPDFDFEYVFNCEIKPNKRHWISALHETMENIEQTTAPGVDGGHTAKPCMFEDIQELKKGACKCYAHSYTENKRKKQRICRVADHDLLYASTSCKDISKMNPNMPTHTILGGRKTHRTGVCTNLFWSVRPHGNEATGYTDLGKCGGYCTREARRGGP